MQSCSRCYTDNPNTAVNCSNCQADLREFSTSAVALKRIQANPRVRMIRIATCADACPECYEQQGIYTKDNVPHLPIEGCAHSLGCRCFYDPMFEENFP